MSSDLEHPSSNSFDNQYDNDNRKSTFKSIISVIPRKARIVLSIVGITIAIIALLILSQPEAKKRPIPETTVKVDVIQVAPSDYPIVVNTSGTIQADTRGNLVSQIRGEIVSVSENFKTGGAFNKGDVLIEVDQRDYQAALSQAAAAVSQAQATFRQEQANAKQAIRDWERLGNTGTPPDLVARKPQLSAARAQLASTEANLETAKLNLERTRIKAPYTGRVIRRDAVLGQYLSVGTVVAEIFATDQVEARLPLSQDEFAQLGLDNLSDPDAEPFNVTLSSEVGGTRYTWDAIVTRTDSTFDLNTRQIDIIASVIEPFDTSNNKPPLRIGQFVNARIQGRTVENAFVIPNKALREGSYVFAADDLKLVRVPVKVLWQDDQNALIESGLEAGRLVVTTSLNSTLAGAKVKLSDPSLAQPSTTPETNETQQAEADAETTEPADQNSVPSEPNTVEASNSNGDSATEAMPTAEGASADN